jgi:hypothetical protein
MEYPPRRRARKVAARKAIGPRKGPVMSKLARAYDALNIFNPDGTLAEKLMGVVCAERQWLDATTGLDESISFFSNSAMPRCLARRSERLSAASVGARRSSLRPGRGLTRAGLSPLSLAMRSGAVNK